MCRRAWSVRLLGVAVAMASVACMDGSRTFAYVASPGATPADVGTLAAFAVDDATGRFSPIVELSIRNPRALAVSPSGRFLYASGSDLDSATGIPQFMAVYRIDPETGGLSGVGEFRFQAAGRPTRMAVHDGVLYVLHHSTSTGTHGGMVAYTLDDDAGSLTWVGPVSSPDDPSFAAIAPRGPFLFVGGEVCVRRCDPVVQASSIEAGGRLVPLGTTIVDAEFIPADGVIDPTGRFLYVVRRSGPVLTYSIDAVTGALGAQGASETGPESTAAASVDAAGRTLFVSSAGDLRSYAIDPGTGRPTQISSTPADETPASLAVARSGRFVYASSAKSREVRAYAVAAGLLTAVGVVAAGGGDVALVDVARTSPNP
jgi:6-phosphogluconolactonase (cycloisomerase 2 family)